MRARAGCGKPFGSPRSGPLRRFLLEDQQAARQLFLRLVTPGEGQEDTRARAAMPSEPGAAQDRRAICWPADTAIGDRIGPRRTADGGSRPRGADPHLAASRGNGSMPTGRSCARARRSCKPRPTGSRTADATICCCPPASNLSAHAPCLPILATSPLTTSRSSSRCHRRARRPSARKKRGRARAR